MFTVATAAHAAIAVVVHWQTCGSPVFPDARGYDGSSDVIIQTCAADCGQGRETSPPGRDRNSGHIRRIVSLALAPAALARAWRDPSGVSRSAVLACCACALAYLNAFGATFYEQRALLECMLGLLIVAYLPLTPIAALKRIQTPDPDSSRHTWTSTGSSRPEAFIIGSSIRRPVITGSTPSRSHTVKHSDRLLP